MADLATCRDHIRVLHHMDEGECVARLARMVPAPGKVAEAVRDDARALVAAVRAAGCGEVESFLQEYGLSTADGRALMGLAEALLRIPDSATQDALIADKLGQGQWAVHRGHSAAAAVNLSTVALTLAQRLAGREAALWPLRRCLHWAIGHLGGIFVLGEDMVQALRRAGHDGAHRHSFDMLGEEARTAAQAERYLTAYGDAIAAVGAAAAGAGVVLGPGVSVKLSALHPRYHFSQRDRVMVELLPRLLSLCQAARSVNIGLTIDAEEAERLELSLDLVTALLEAPELAGWDGLGLAVQAYQKRAIGVVDWVVAAARQYQRRLCVRLVKGAYWDHEIKRAQELGLSTYPVFTRKSAADQSYLACARALLVARDVVFPAFATHNAVTVAWIKAMAGAPAGDWEFQRLHGMGRPLYQVLGRAWPCRVYAPVGPYQHLLPYLVRRLLENGANASFVHAVANDSVDVETAVNGVVDDVALPLPADVFAPYWRLATGPDLSDGETLSALRQAVMAYRYDDRPRPLSDPAPLVNDAVDAFAGWDQRGGAARADILERAAMRLEAEPTPFLHLALAEAGKTWPDALAELREAVDFLRYYAAEARRLFAAPHPLPAVTGEANSLRLAGRGVFACISPWNFPLSIFLGQIAAALAAGNCVVAKPAPQTPRMAQAAVRLLHQAGVPAAVLALAVGDDRLGAALIGQPGLAGVAFTGSHATARAIAAALAQRPGPLVPMIAETGGVNAMVVDSSALPEQAAADIVASAFLSAGQRCSALRLLFVQDDIADSVLALVAGMVAELRLGDPLDPATDIGPLIDAEALARLRAADTELAGRARLLFRGQEPAQAGCFLAPRAYEVGWGELPTTEIFGPILQVVRWRRSQWGAIMAWLNSNGHGLTLGVHSRIDSLAQQIIAQARIGNIYVNRRMTGAMVGAQPFGGLGLSGTGPKTGGPFTLLRYATEMVSTVNLAAVGGNVELLCGRKPG